MWHTHFPSSLWLLYSIRDAHKSTKQSKDRVYQIFVLDPIQLLMKLWERATHQQSAVVSRGATSTGGIIDRQVLRVTEQNTIVADGDLQRIDSQCHQNFILENGMTQILQCAACN